MKNLYLFAVIFIFATQNQTIGSIESGNTQINAYETRVILTTGNTVIHATLNNTKSDQHLISKLPYTITLSRYQSDYCGVMPGGLEYDISEAQGGWKAGEIHYTLNGNWLAIFFAGELQRNGSGFIKLGNIDTDISVLQRLGSSVSFTISLAN